jgi:hypothetical protein
VHRSKTEGIVLGATMLAISCVAACSSHHPPTLGREMTAGGTRGTFAGVALTVPAHWRLVPRGPAPCGSVVGDSAYFYVDSGSPRLGCSSGPPTGPYLTVTCHPYGYGSSPSGRLIRVGPFNASEQDGTVGLGGHELATIYLDGRDTLIDIYAAPTVVRAIKSSIGGAPGSC